MRTRCLIQSIFRVKYEVVSLLPSQGMHSHYTKLAFYFIDYGKVYAVKHV